MDNVIPLKRQKPVDTEIEVKQDNESDDFDFAQIMERNKTNQNKQTQDRHKRNIRTKRDYNLKG